MINEDEKERSTAESTQRDLVGAAQMGQSAARSAKTLSKAAAEASAGNVMCAAVTILKDQETRKWLFVLILLPILFLSLLSVFFLYALPVSIYEVVTSYVDTVEEQWRQEVYDGGGDITFKKIYATIKVGGEVVGDFFTGIWDGIKGLFTKDAGGDTGSTADLISENAIELQVTQVEASEKQTLQNKINACISKIDARSAEIEEGIRASEGAISSAIAAYFNANGEYSSFITQVQISRTSMSQDGAIQLLSLYTVQTGASLEQMQLSDLMRWLGWYDSRHTGTTSFSLGGIDVACQVNTWNGTFLPQYLYEQKQQELDRYGDTVTDFDEKACAAVDMLLVVDCPYISEIPVQKSVVYETMLGPDGEEVTVSKTVGTAYLNINIVPRSAASLANLAGLWTGALKDAQPELTFDSGLDQGSTDSGYITGDASTVGSGHLLWPLAGYTQLSSTFGYRICPYHGRELHGAVDIPAPGGTPILAADSGTVTISKFNSSLGNYVRIDHGNGTETRYCHMVQRAVSVGDVVAQGQVIGYVGTTGSSTGNHLDFAVYQNGSPKDPMTFSYTYP